MGIIDNGRHALLGVQWLETSAHRLQTTHSLQHLALIGPQQQRRTIDRKQIVGIEPAEELNPQLILPHTQQHTVEQHLQHLATEVGQRTQRVAAHLSAAVLHHHLAIAVIDINQCKGALVQSIEEQFLGPDILDKGAVIVQMVVREVCENSASELQPPDTLLHQRVRRHLHKAVVAARINHLAQHSIQADGIGCGMGRLNLTLANTIDHRRNQSRTISQRTKQIAEQRGNRSLAIGTRHTYQLQLMRGVVVEGGCHIGHSHIAILDNNITHLVAHIARQLLAHHNGGSRLNGLVDVLVAIGLRTSDSKEAVARLDLARIVLQGVYLYVGRCRERDNLCGR